MRNLLVRALAPALLFSLFTLPAGAQSYPESVQRWLDNCRDQRNTSWGDSRSRTCEVRQMAVPRGTRSLEVDGRTNGGIRVVGWDRDSIAVFAMIQSQAPSDEDAREIARQIRISTRDGRIRAENEPSLGRRSGYSVSYHIFAPRRMDLDLRTHNGGVAVDGISGVIGVEAHNGGVTMRNVAGDVRGRTTNGGISLSLSGSRWEGRGAELRTTNGGVTVSIPAQYNAELEASTVNGGLSIDFPVTLQGRIDRNIRTTIGSGGPPIRVTTTNGGVRVRRS